VQTIPTIDLYRELEVDPAASAETIEAAWKSLLKRHHPDVSANPAAAVEKVKRLNLAHEWLSDPQRRAMYDRARRQPRVVRPPAPPQPAAPSTTTVRQATTTSAGPAPGPTATPPHNPYGEYARPTDRPYTDPTPPRPTPVARPRRRPSTLALALVLALSSSIVVLAAAYVIASPSLSSASETVTPSPSGGGAGAGSPVSGALASSGVDPRTLPSPDVRSAITAPCPHPTVSSPILATAKGTPAFVYTVQCSPTLTYGPIVYVASDEGWQRVGTGDPPKVTGIAAGEFAGRMTQESSDEFGIAWSHDAKPTTLALYRITDTGVDPFWDSSGTNMTWIRPALHYKGDGTAPGILEVLTVTTSGATIDSLYQWDPATKSLKSVHSEAISSPSTTP
jgi:hypothetical protein